MEIRQLRYLVALAEERSFTRAAAREHVAQPALSQQIRRLEQELGLALVQRTTRRVMITEAGEALVRRARMVLAELEAAHEEMQALRGAWKGRVRVGAMHTMGPVDISLAIAGFRRLHPQVEVTMLEHSSEELAELLRIGELDMAFLSVTERIESRGLALRQLVSEELVLALPPGHPLASRAPVALHLLAGEEFVSYRPGARLRELLTSAAAAAGFAPQITLESNDSRRILRLVARGLGVALLPRSDCAGADAEVAVVELLGPPLTRDITLAWLQSRRLAPAASEFLALALETFGAASADASTAEAATAEAATADAATANAGAPVTRE
jgi:LysR family transcriptional activator of glutamate synthase operon